MTEKEKNLISGCLREEKSAWDAFVLQYSDLVYHTIKRTFNLYHTEARQDSVEDLFQEFFLSLIQENFKKLHQFRGDRGCSLASWLRVVASRRTIDYLRGQKQRDVEATESLSAEQPDPPDFFLNDEQEALLSKALEALSPRERILINLMYRQDLSPDDIASILKISVGALYTQKSRLLAKLREILEKSAAL